MNTRLKELRKEKNITLVDIEKQTGIKRSTYSDYENGIVKTGNLKTWKKLADYFNVSVTELMGVDDYMKSFVDSINDLDNQYSDVLNKQLNIVRNKVNNHEVNMAEKIDLAFALELTLQIHDKYGYDSDIATDIFTILRMLSSFINNSSDDYQNTIDGFTKLVNNLKEQNKKATD